MSVQSISFKNQGETLFGMSHLPEGKDRALPAVLFLHGFLGDKLEAHRIFLKMAHLLEKEGIASLRFDFRGCGESEGDSKALTLDSMVSDAKAALSFLKQQPKIDSSKIALLGMSLGGGIASILAGTVPGISALVLWAPVADLLECTQIKIGDQDSKHIFQAPFIDYGGEFVGQKFLSQIPHFSPATHLEEFEGAVKLIQGTEDQIVPIHQSEIYEKIFSKKNPDSKVIPISGSDHQFSSAPWQEELFKETLLFLRHVWS